MENKYIIVPVQLIDATKCYYNEAKWREESDTPVTVDEHLRFSVPSCCCMHVACLAFTVIGASGDAIEWGMTYPKIMRASCVIGRVINDVASHEVTYLQLKIYAMFYFICSFRFMDKFGILLVL